MVSYLANPQKAKSEGAPALYSERRLYGALIASYYSTMIDRPVPLKCVGVLFIRLASASGLSIVFKQLLTFIYHLLLRLLSPPGVRRSMAFYFLCHLVLLDQGILSLVEDLYVHTLKSLSSFSSCSLN